MDMDHIMTWATDVAKGRLLSTYSGERSLPTLTRDSTSGRSLGIFFFRSEIVKYVSAHSTDNIFIFFR